VAELDRSRCRQVFKQRFSVARMAQDYVAIYQALQPQQRAVFEATA
jgi:hypothetical protein